MKLKEILDELEFEKIINPPLNDGEMDISSVHYDSRTVREKGLFVAVKGLVSDGHEYIEKALELGAGVIVSEKEVETLATQIIVKDSRKALSAISDIFYQKPTKDMCVIGITGTNGKTTTTYMIESILEKAGIKCGVIGTVNYRYCGKIFPNPRTTPESLDLHRILSEMKENKVTHVVMEVSSHAIDLKRCDNVKFDLALFTNLTQDHLDYHSDMEEYWDIKKSLFTELLMNSKKEKKAVINIMDPKGPVLLKELENKDLEIYSIGLESAADIHVEDLTMDISGINCRVVLDKESFDLKSDAVGKHNVENILCAAGVAKLVGADISSIKSGLESFAVPGRLERVLSGRNVFVDYAHTPDALENVLSTLKKVGDGRLITVFGCGGDRDKTKRPLMGEISGKYSDVSIVTSDNPRTEDPLLIIEDILKAFGSDRYKKVEDLTSESFTSPSYYVEPDRKKAIEKGIEIAKDEDIVIIAGKGHETYQEIGKERFPFNDSSIAKDVMI